MKKDVGVGFIKFSDLGLSGVSEIIFVLTEEGYAQGIPQQHVRLCAKVYDKSLEEKVFNGRDATYMWNSYIFFERTGNGGLRDVVDNMFKFVIQEREEEFSILKKEIDDVVGGISSGKYEYKKDVYVGVLRNMNSVGQGICR